MFNNVFGQDLKDNDLSEGITGRKVLNAPSVDSKDTSKVAIKICVNQGGVVTYAEIIPGETTLKDKTTLIKYLKAARNYTVQPDKTAPKEQCGKLTYNPNGIIRSN
jgi:hypothetical protein